MSQTDLADAVAQLELESGLPRGKFAKRAGHDTATIRRIVQQETTPEDHVLVNIARSCGRPYDALVRIKYEGGRLPPASNDGDELQARLDALEDRIANLEGAVSEVIDLRRKLTQQDDPTAQEDPA